MGELIRAQLCYLLKNHQMGSLVKNAANNEEIQEDEVNKLYNDSNTMKTLMVDVEEKTKVFQKEHLEVLEETKLITSNFADELDCQYSCFVKALDRPIGDWQGILGDDDIQQKFQTSLFELRRSVENFKQSEVIVEDLEKERLEPSVQILKNLRNVLTDCLVANAM